MEKFPCKIVSLDKLIVSPHGSITPMCNTCKTVECGYRIEYRTVSVFGINKTMRCVISGNTPGIVAQCDGYTS